MRRIRVADVAVAVVLLSSLFAGCASSGAHQATATQTPVATGRASWILTKVALNALTANPCVRARLSGAQIFEILSGTEQPATSVPVVPTMSFKSFTTLQDTLSRGALPPDIRAIIYDSEHWSQTPPKEQRDPATFYRRAASLVHAHGLIFIATPAMDLVSASGGKAADPAAVFVARHIGADAARYADVVDIQAQSLERDAAAYGGFVAQVSAQIRGANPKAIVLAGLSTNPPGTEITPDMLVAAMRATAGRTTGFWMNVPGKGNDCPHCNQPRPDVAVAALDVFLT